MRNGLETRKISKSDRKLFNENLFPYLADRESGVVIAHVFHPKVVSQMIVVYAERKLVIDTSEDFPMLLSEDLLRNYRGKQATALRVGEVAMMVSLESRLSKQIILV